MRAHRLLACLALLTSGVRAQDSLSLDSPFLPPGGVSAQPGATASPTGIEFCGVLSSEGKVWLGFYEPSTQRGRWLPLDESIDGWAIQAYDAARRSVTLSVQGQVQTLLLKEPKMDGSGAPPLTAAAPPPQEPQNHVMVGPPNGPADEAERLKAVAEEIKRRRMLRQKLQSQPRGTSAPTNQK